MSNEQRVIGQFTWNTTTGQWFWDAGMFALHGYRPDAVAVSTDLVLQHKAPEHRAHAAGVVERSAREDQRFSNHHDIVDVEGHRRTVLTVGVSRADSSLPTLATRFSRGFMVDVTQDEHDSTQRALERVRQGVASTAQSGAC